MGAKRDLIFVTPVREKGRITLPLAVRDEFGLADGTHALLIASGGRLELVPASVVPRDQLWCFTEPIRGRIGEAENDVACARIRRLDTLRSLPDAIRDLSGLAPDAAPETAPEAAPDAPPDAPPEAAPGAAPDPGPNAAPQRDSWDIRDPGPWIL